MGRILIIDVSSWITGMGGGKEGRMGGGWGEGREEGGRVGGGKGGGWEGGGREGRRVGGGKGGGWGEGREEGGGWGEGREEGGTFIIASVSSHQCGLVVFAYCRCIFFP